MSYRKQQVCLSTYDLLLPPGIKGLIAILKTTGWRDTCNFVMSTLKTGKNVFWDFLSEDL